MCPQDINYCEGADNFEITGANQRIRVDTGTVISNRTCEYRFYVGDSATVKNYTLTINVDYVYGDSNATTLDVYKVNSTDRYYKLSGRADVNSTNDIEVHINDHYEVYVLMNPHDTSSSAGFNVYVREYHETEDDKTSPGIIALIVLLILTFLIILGVVVFFCLYKKLCKRKRLINEAVQKPTDLPIYEEKIEVEDKVDQAEQQYEVRFQVRNYF